MNVWPQMLQGRNQCDGQQITLLFCQRPLLPCCHLSNVCRSWWCGNKRAEIRGHVSVILRLQRVQTSQGTFMSVVRLLTRHFHVIFSSEIAYTYKSWCVDIFVEFMSNSECLKYSRSLFLRRTPSFKQVMYLFMDVSFLNRRNCVLHLHTCFAKFIQYFLTGAHSGTRGSEFRFLLCGDPSVRQYFSTRPVVHDALVTREEEHGRWIGSQVIAKPCSSSLTFCLHRPSRRRV